MHGFAGQQAQKDWWYDWYHLCARKQAAQVLGSNQTQCEQYLCISSVQEGVKIKMAQELRLSWFRKQYWSVRKEESKSTRIPHLVCLGTKSSSNYKQGQCNCFKASKTNILPGLQGFFYTFCPLLAAAPPLCTRATMASFRTRKFQPRPPISHSTHFAATLGSKILPTGYLS